MPPSSGSQTSTGELAQQIAERAAHILAVRLEKKPEGLVDARRLAEILDVRPAWVREHAADLCAIRLGSGPKAPLRFDVERVFELLAVDGAKPADDGGEKSSHPPQRPIRRAASTPTRRRVSLLNEKEGTNEH
jgi:hypothetical protein